MHENVNRTLDHLDPLRVTACVDGGMVKEWATDPGLYDHSSAQVGYEILLIRGAMVDIQERVHNLLDFIGVGSKARDGGGEISFDGSGMAAGAERRHQLVTKAGEYLAAAAGTDGAAFASERGAIDIMQQTTQAGPEGLSMIAEDISVVAGGLADLMSRLDNSAGIAGTMRVDHDKVRDGACSANQTLEAWLQRQGQPRVEGHPD